MSANLEHMAYRFADRSDVPWHGLGTPIDRNDIITTGEFQRRAGASWKVVRRPLWVRAGKDTPFKDHIESDQFALMRDDNHFILNYVSKQYQPVQNETVFQFFHDFCAAGDMDLETGGVLDSGRTVWCLASIREGFTLAGGDSIQGYLLFSNSHSGSAGRIKFTPIRVVCANTLAMAHEGSGSEFRIHHRSKFVPEIAKTAVGLGHQTLQKFRDSAEFLASRPMHSPQFKGFLDRLFPEYVSVNKETKEETTVRPRMYDKSMHALWTQKGADLSSGTWWQGYNAITYAIDHDDTRKDCSAQLNSTLFGNGMKVKQQALKLALEMAR